MKLFKLTFATVSALFVAFGANAESITVVSWGGAYTKSQVEAYHKPWSQKTGNQVVSEDYSGGLAEVKAQVDDVRLMTKGELKEIFPGCDIITERFFFIPKSYIVFRRGDEWKNKNSSIKS